MRILIDNILDVLSNFKWNLIFYLKYCFNSGFRTMMVNNTKFKNCHINERCFIVGNGPSLNKIDLRKLTNETVFTVNEIVKDEEKYNLLNSDFHILIDPSYYNLPENSEDLLVRLNLFKQINYENKKPKCIVSYQAKKVFESKGINKIVDLIYIYQHKNLFSLFSFKPDLSRNLPISQNVIHTAIYAAIYMGFTKIYLVGCDMTSVFQTFLSDESGNKTVLQNLHAYDENDTDKRFYLNSCLVHDNEYMLYDYAKTFTIFKKIKKYTDTNGIEIINATKGGGLDVFVRQDYDSLFF